MLVCEPVNWLAGFLLLLLSDYLFIDFPGILKILIPPLIIGFFFCLFETFINNCISVVRQNNSDSRLERKDSLSFAKRTNVHCEHFDRVFLLEVIKILA